MKTTVPVQRSGPSVLIVVGILVLAGLAGTAALVWYYRPAASPAGLSRGSSVAALGRADEVVAPALRFRDITAPSGVHFRHTSGAFGKRLLPETMGAGVAFLDCDNDGHQDLLFVNSCFWPGHEDRTAAAPTLALYRNKGDGAFEDITQRAGLAVTLYGMGVTTGDFDNDGWTDVFVTGVGGNRLFRNRNGKEFSDVTAEAGVGGPGGWSAAGDFLDRREPVNYSSSATFLDHDGDGRLDLFVCNYVTWAPALDLSQGFQLLGLGRAYGPPTAFEGAQCILYHNRGDGRFEDVSARAGIHVLGDLQRPVGKALGVVACDADDDGWPDVVVANDTVRNFLFHNKGDGTFEEAGELTGVAYAEGRARGAMGIDWGVYRPGRAALLIGNFADEPNTFLRLEHRRPLLFTDAALAEGIAGPSRPLLKFGTFFFDCDLDGWQDLLTCNGHVEPEINKVQAGQRYEQPPQLFWNRGPGSKAGFIAVPANESAADLFRPMVGRGSACADIDGDGDLDVVLTANGGPARLLRNETDTGHHWVRFVLQGDGQRSNRSAVGAKVVLEAGGLVQVREVLAARGYLSQNELAVTFGLGTTDRIDRVTIRWPGRRGGEQQLTELAIDRVHRVRQDGP